MANKTIHILRYGTAAEKTHLEKAISSYDYLGINGNSAAYVAGAISKFIVEKFFSKPDKGFFIDPITYAFQNEIKLLKKRSKATGMETIKKSVRMLIEEYGSPINKVEADIPVAVSDFDDEVRKTFCHNVLKFQYDLVFNHIEKNDLQKYLDYAVLGDKKLFPQLRPKFLIAPYFYLNSNNESFQQWLNLNINFIHLAKKVSRDKCNDSEVFAQVVISKETLMDSFALSRIVDAYKNVPCDGFTVWIDDLNEHDASFEELSRFVKLLKGLNHKPVYNMYGGYFSVLLTHKQIGLLAGVSHGLEYGESRKVYPVGGGIPISKYYYFPLHQRMDFTKAYYLLTSENIIDTSKIDWGTAEKYYKEICKCEQCKKVIRNEMINFVEFESKEFYEVHRNDQVLRRKKASLDTKQNCLYHYLLCKKMEFKRVSNKSLPVLLDEMKQQKCRYMNYEALKKSELDYIDTWIRTIKGV